MPQHVNPFNDTAFKNTLKNMEKMKEIPFALRDEAFRRLSEVGSVAALSPEEKSSYDEDQKRYWILTTIEKTRYDEGVAKGIEEGRAEGRAEERRESIRMMLSLDVPIGTVAEKYGMTVEELRKFLG